MPLSVHQLARFFSTRWLYSLRWVSLALLFVVPPMAGCSSGSATSDIRTEEQSFAYRANGPFADVLKRCVLVGTVADSCSLSTLPLISQRTSGVASTEMILEHVLVTHNWMGKRFAELLDTLPEDIRTLLGGVTAIYIGSDVRPSYYSTLNGAIHLDPARLWLYTEEKNTVSKSEDYRSSFGADLQLDFYRRFVRNGQYAWDFFSLDDNSERTLDDIRLPMARLLYHELAHANDFLPAEQRSSLATHESVYAAVDSVRDNWRSPLLQSDYPLNSTQLKSLAQVRYRGLQATEQDIGMTPEFAGAQLDLDGAAYFYGYSSEAEELAGLFVAVMMKYHFDVAIDMAFVAKPAGSLRSGCELPVGWGKHDRLANKLVATRARYATQLILGDATPALGFVDEILSDTAAQEISLAQGAGWCATLID